MKKWLTAILAFACIPTAFSSQEYLVIKLRLLTGTKKGMISSPQVITAYHLTPVFSGSIVSDFNVDRQIESLKRVFHLESVQILSEADLFWAPDSREEAFHIVRLNGQEFIIRLQPEPGENSSLFHIQVDESQEKEKRNLLNTQVILPYSQVAVLGFANSQQKPFFIAFHVEGGITGKPTGPGSPETGMQKIAATPAVLPRIISQKPLQYPEIARKARIQGIVTLTVKIDARGHVIQVLIQSGHPLLNNAAVEAVKDWIFEPHREHGQAVPAMFSLTVPFILTGQSSGAAVPGTRSAAAETRAIPSSQAPRLRHRVNPEYPPVALAARIQAIVHLQAAIDGKGRVTDATILSGHPLLNEAAIHTVKKWEYEPFLEKGRPIAVSFPVSVSFRLADTPTAASLDSGRLTPQKVSVNKVKLLNKVNPTYPPEALAQKIQGVVVLEVVTTPQGKVDQVKVISGHPLLNDSAIEAIKQWEYAPFIKDGKPISIRFTVTCQFQLQN